MKSDGRHRIRNFRIFFCIKLRTIEFLPHRRFPTVNCCFVKGLQYIHVNTGAQLSGIAQVQKIF